LDGGEGSDTADFSSFGKALWIDLNANGREVKTRDTGDLNSGTWREIVDLNGVENLVLGSGADEVWGSEDANRISGGAGNDTIHGRGGNDIIDGGLGTKLRGVAYDGDDVLYGDGGDDIILVQWNDEVHGGDDNDTLSFANINVDLNVDLAA